MAKLRLRPERLGGVELLELGNANGNANVLGKHTGDGK